MADLLFRVHRSELLPALDAACAASDRGAKIPILSHVLIRPEGDTLRLRGTDLDIEIDATCQLLEPSPAMGIALSASDLLSLVKSLPEASEISFSSGRNSGQITVETRASRFTLLSLPEKDFPSIASTIKGETFETEIAPLIGAIGKVLFAVDKADSGRPYTLGIYVAPDEESGKILVAATNLRSLGAIRLSTQTEARFSPVLIPSKLAQTMRKLFSDEKSSASITVSDHLIGIRCGDIAIFSRLIDAEFPVRIFETLPQTPDHAIVASVEAMKTSVRRILMVARDVSKEGVRLSLGAGGMRMELINAQGEFIVEDVPVDFDGNADFAIGLNGKALSTLLDSISTQDVRIGLTANGNTVFRPTADIDDTFAIAPMHARGAES